MKRCYYSGTIAEFLDATPDSILGALAAAHSFELTPTQLDAWVEQITVLRPILAAYRDADQRNSI
jgi:hypothetical protein